MSDKLIEALEFYADEKRYKTPLYDEKDLNNLNMPYPDKGHAAREALAAYSESKINTQAKANTLQQQVDKLTEALEEIREVDTFSMPAADGNIEQMLGESAILADQALATNKAEGE